MQRLGIIASSGGSAFAAAQALLASHARHAFVGVVVDRACGFEEVARRMAIPSTRVPWSGEETFSTAAVERLRGFGADACLLFFTRRVTAPLLGSMPVWNIHKSMLPAFQGAGTAAKVVAAGVRMCGATLHEAIAQIDSGRILAQVCSPLPVGSGIDQVRHVAYLHAVYLTLMAAEFARLDLVGPEAHGGNLPLAPSACPALPDRALASSFQSWASRSCPSVVFHG